jgi:hypothetical protein
MSENRRIKNCNETNYFFDIEKESWEGDKYVGTLWHIDRVEIVVVIYWEKKMVES